MSKLIRDEYLKRLKQRLSYSSSRWLNLTPIQSGDYWIIDRVRDGFTRFCELESLDCSWMDAWAKYMGAFTEVSFKCSYQHEVDYMWRGERYSIRHGAPKWLRQYMTGYDDEGYKRWVIAAVGVLRKTHGASKDFPPARLQVLFPCYTPGMIIGEGWQYELFDHPNTVTEANGDVNAYSDSSKFNTTVDQYENWRKIAERM